MTIALTLLNNWAVVAAQLFRGNPAGLDYKIAAAYLEFDNSGSAVDPVPTVVVTSGLDYYEDLNTNYPNRDYLRVPILASNGDCSDALAYAGDNIGIFLAQTQDQLGVHGLSFSAASTSRIYGGALVAVPGGWADPTLDVVVARGYIPTAYQLSKLSDVQQILLNFRLSFS